MKPAAARLDIAILAHSTNPRGGVVHALELGEALVRLGHRAIVHAPDVEGRGFFRSTLCDTVALPAAPVDGGTAAMVEARAAGYVDYFRPAGRRRFDVWHAQDGISGNALATLKAEGLIHGFVRTVHHVDDFADPRLAALQARSIVEADHLLVVSRMWRDWASRTLGRPATVVGNGVDTTRFSPRPGPADRALRQRLGLTGEGPVLLSVGGIERRKNSLGLLAAFRQLAADHPAARLVIAGGATLLDHGAYRAAFDAALAESSLPEGAVVVAGPLSDHEMPALYRLAATLVFPSLREGFGLAVLEAMASGVPVVASRIAPFTEYLEVGDVIWCDPDDAASITRAMRDSLSPDRRPDLVRRGAARAAAHDWSAVAAAHLGAYRRQSERSHA